MVLNASGGAKATTSNGRFSDQISFGLSFSQIPMRVLAPMKSLALERGRNPDQFLSSSREYREGMQLHQRLNIAFVWSVVLEWSSA
jgi:hypothetical protein